MSHHRVSVTFTTHSIHCTTWFYVPVNVTITHCVPSVSFTTSLNATRFLTPHTATTRLALIRFIQICPHTHRHPKTRPP
jgi:hypothetical protein